MSLTLLGWLLVVCSAAISATLVFPLPSRRPRAERLDLQACKASFEDIRVRVTRGKLTEAEADAARLVLVSRLQPAGGRFGLKLESGPPMWIAAAAVFLFVSGIGAAMSYGTYPSKATNSAGAGSESDDELVSRLASYANSIGGAETAPVKAAATQLPDVDTMIDRLAARLEANPEDLDGWVMLGRSYFHMARYEQAAAAFGRALQLDPGSGDLKQSYEEANAKAAAGNKPETVASAQVGSKQTEIKQIGSGDGSGDGSGVEKSDAPQAIASPEQDPAIRSMVDRLAQRLESSPRDVAGWTNLMRSRVVLGEREVAATALRKALEVFTDDPTASGTIIAAATELGLKAE